jgi:hypothetical protein
MKVNISNLVGVLTLCLLTSTVLAGKKVEYDSSALVDPVVRGQIKLECVTGTPFKNEFPLLTNGNGSGTVFKTYTIPLDPELPEGDSVDVTVTVNWDDNNSFEFTVSEPGAFSRLIVSSGQTLDYDYLAVLGKPIDADQQVHAIVGGGTGPDISHLDFCLVSDPEPPVDETPPVISDVDIIPVPGEGTVDVSPDGDYTVSGLVTVQATVTDESDFSVILKLDGEELGQATADPNSDIYKYQWATTDVPSGNYILQIVVTDSFGNQDTVTLIVTVVTPLDACLEGGDKIPPNEDSEGGCSIPYVQLEYPDELAAQFPELTVTQALIPAKPGTQTTTCGLDANGDVISEFITQDARVDENGKVLDIRDLYLSDLFDIQGYFGEFYPGEPVPNPKLDYTNYAVPCIVLYYQRGPDFDEFGKPASFFFVEDTGGPTSVLTQDAADENAPDLFANAERLTAPLNFCTPEEGVCEPVPACFASGAECYQPSQQWIEKATVQPDDISLLVRHYLFDGTFQAYNPARVRSFKGTLAAVNIRQICPELASDSSTLVPGTAEYLAAEQQCKKDQAIELFFDLETAIKESARNLPGPDDVNAILNEHSKALSQIKVDRFDRALRDLKNLLDEVATAPWDDIDVFNDPGRLVMYTQALIFRVEQLKTTDQCLNRPSCLDDYASVVLP